MEVLQIWGINLTEKKEQIRKQALAQRGRISENMRREYSRKIAEQVISHPLFLWAEEIYCYVSHGTEVPTNELFSAAWRCGRFRKCKAPMIWDFILFDP